MTDFIPLSGGVVSGTKIAPNSGEFLIISRTTNHDNMYRVFATVTHEEFTKFAGMWQDKELTADAISDLCVAAYDCDMAYDLKDENGDELVDSSLNYLWAYRTADGGIIHQHST